MRSLLCADSLGTFCRPLLCVKRLNSALVHINRSPDHVLTKVNDGGKKMKKFTMFACVAMTLVFALGSWAGEFPAYTNGTQSVLHGGSSNFAKASGDTIDLMGPLGTYTGTFDGGFGSWTHIDITEPTTSHFQRSTTNNDIAGITGTSAWCGDFIAACTPADSAWGYGNNWNDLIEFRKTVTNTAQSTTLSVTGNLFHDSEPGYDYTEFGQLIFNTVGLQNIVNSYDDEGSEILSESFTWLPGEYMNGNQVVMQVRFRSDGGWSDGDCSYQSRGGCNLDNLVVTATGGLAGVYSDNFEASWGNWAVAFPNGVGDFTYIWTGLEDEDPCNTNFSNQVAFIDDGIVVPGTGGSDCINWCYGPSGYIVNTTGGLAGPSAHLFSALESTPMTWPNAAYDGIWVAWNVFVHEDLSDDAPGMFYTWGVRSADTDGSNGDPQVLADQAWADRNFVYYGGPSYRRDIQDVTDLMAPGRDVVQLQLACYELGWAWGWVGNDGYPAPYFDNANVKVFPVVGPSIVTRDIDIANDNFPERVTINTADLGSHSVRFDMARNIALATHLRNDPGDSIVFDVVPVRTGSTLNGNPVMHWTLDPNPVFNSYRTSVYGAATTGTWTGIPAVGISGLPDPDAWQFDLPDTGFLYPGDKLHYYIEASDNLLGDITTSTSPADLTGYGDFSHPLAYNNVYTIDALPTISSDGFGGYTQPGLLFLNDQMNYGGEVEWYGAFDNAGLLEGRDYDTYSTNGPSSGVSNGIGGRASHLTLTGYSDIFYSSGTLTVNTISNGDFANDAGNDVDVLTNWLLLGNKDFFGTGDDLAADLAQAGTATLAFLEDYMGLSFFNTNIITLIDQQATPTVQALTGNGVFADGESWVAYGGCAAINRFDAVELQPGAVQLAEFLDGNGLPGAYTYSAATMNVPALAATSRVISMPYDLQFIYTDPNAKAPAPLAIRAMLVQEILGEFGIDTNPGDVTPVPGAQKFATRNYPNPFNPTTKIEYTMPKAGHLTLKVYNVRGELVRTLVDEVVDASGSVMWDGTSDSGSSVSSGVYFYEARYGNEVQVQKMALVK